MNPNAANLAMRDPAMAYLMGVDPSSGGDFGQDADLSDFGEDYFPDYEPYSAVSPFDISRNIGSDFGWGSYGADAATPPSALAAAARPHPAEVAAAFRAHHAAKHHTSKRAMLLDPNAFSTLKVERYSFSITQALTLNTALAFNTTLQPSTKIRPQRVVANAPTPNFVLLSSLQISNVNVFVGGTEDAFTYNAGGMGIMLDLPTLEPAYRATMAGNYTGFVPPGFAIGFAYTFVLTFQGPSTIAGNG